MKMKINHILLGLVIVSILAISGCSEKDNKDNKDNKVVVHGISDCAGTDTDSINYCHWGKGVQTSNLSECGKISDEYLKDDCLSSVARALNDSGICEGISDMEKKGYCVDMIFSDAAFVRGDGSICMKITSGPDRAACLTNIGIITENASLCTMMDDETSKDDCLSTVGAATINETLCGMAKDEGRRAECYSSVAVSSLNKSLCDNVIDPFKKAECLYNVESAINATSMDG